MEKGKNAWSVDFGGTGLDVRHMLLSQLAANPEGGTRIFRASWYCCLFCSPMACRTHLNTHQDDCALTGWNTPICGIQQAPAAVLHATAEGALFPPSPPAIYTHSSLQVGSQRRGKGCGLSVCLQI